MKTLRIFVLLSMTVTTLAGSGSQAAAMNLLVAIGVPEAAKITETAMAMHAKEMAKLEPAVGEAKQDKANKATGTGEEQIKN